MGFNVAIIGLGNIGLGYDLAVEKETAMTHAGACKAHRDVERCYGIDPDVERGKLFEGFTGGKSYRNVAELSEDVGKVDICVIATPSNLRSKILFECEKLTPSAVIVEKPLAETVKEASIVRSFCADRAISLYVNYIRLFEPVLRDLRERIAGDEFAMILCCLGQERHIAVNKVTIVVEKIKELFTDPIIVNGVPIEVTFSIGIKIFPDNEQEWKDVIINADVAMYHAKRNGKNRYQFFNAKIDEESKHFLQVKNDFAKALKTRQLVLHYQPRVQISTGKIVGFEALVRWRKADGSLIYPGDFLSVTQGNTLGYELSEYVIDEATRQIERWQRRYPDLELRISINLSGEQFNSATFMQRLMDIVTEQPANVRRCMEFEIVEDVFVKDIEYTIGIIEEFRNLDISFSIDDFGTGYSSINYLKRLPVETLKIDQSFILDLFEGKNDKIVQLIVNTAKIFGMKTVAEGVENLETLETLKRLGCDFYQGYHFSPPLPPEEVEKRWLDPGENLEKSDRKSTS